MFKRLKERKEEERIKEKKKSESIFYGSSERIEFNQLNKFASNAEHINFIFQKNVSNYLWKVL